MADPPRISSDPKTWRCAASGMTANLWLNLSTGYIGGGRKNHDGRSESFGLLLVELRVSFVIIDIGAVVALALR